MGLLNSNDINDQILSQQRIMSAASGLLKKVRPARPQPFLRAERPGMTRAWENGENPADGFFQQTLNDC